MDGTAQRAERVRLPPPMERSDVSIEEALRHRRSMRAYAGDGLTLAEASQLLWAAQGTTDRQGLRTAPSAGALYPLEVYLVAGGVADLAPGVYRYLPDEHQLLPRARGDRRAELAHAALDQHWVGDAAAALVITAVPARTTVKYGGRGVRYVHMEAGHAGQNVCLQAEALGLGATMIGAFYDHRVRQIVAAPLGEQALYVIPIGRKP